MNEETPFSASSTGPGYAASPVDPHIVGVWYAPGSLGGYQFEARGAAMPLHVDGQSRLQIDPYDTPIPFSTPLNPAS